MNYGGEQVPRTYNCEFISPKQLRWIAYLETSKALRELLSDEDLQVLLVYPVFGNKMKWSVKKSVKNSWQIAKKPQ